MIPRKQSATHEDFVAAWLSVADPAWARRAEALLASAAERVRAFCPGRAAYGWSGGKDSLALAEVCRRAGVNSCVLGLTDGLEYRQFLAWATANMPPGLTVLKNGWGLEWLAAHPEMLFPQNTRTAGKWFRGVQRELQDAYCRSRGVEILILGRRRADGNWVGPAGRDHYTARGAVRYSPLADWAHEDVLAVLRLCGWTMATLPPFYRWPRGFRCGTHPWPARQWCGSQEAGWSEVWSIEPERVEEAAAAGVAGAAEVLWQMAKDSV